MARRAGESDAGVLFRAALFGLVGGAVGLVINKALASRQVPSRGENTSLAQSRTEAPVSQAPPSTHMRRDNAVRQLYAGSATLAFSVLADSGLEHYRGGFYNKVMFVAPTVSAMTLALSSRHALHPTNGSGVNKVVYATATLTGLVGTGFHIYNTAKREGGFNWLNLFYGAPLAAPAGITFAGLLGLAAHQVSQGEEGYVLGWPIGQLLSFAAVSGLSGTAAEAGLLHFRGAFQDPFMYLPVTVPPAAATALGIATFHHNGTWQKIAQLLLKSTALLGFIGMGFHAYGIQRNMGGWGNWSQMILQGPPLPAPPSFTGMALAGLAGLVLQEEGNA
jgi:hypothetical protein